MDRRAAAALLQGRAARSLVAAPSDPLSAYPILAIIFETADRHGLDRAELLGGAIAESNLNPHAARYGAWPDVSFGLYQQTVRWADEGDQSDRPENVALVRDLYFDPVYSANKAAPKYRHYRQREATALDAWCRYNRPWLSPSANPTRVNYQRGLREAAAIVAGLPAKPAPDGWQPVNLIGRLPTRAGAPPYPPRDLDAVDSVDLHYTAAPPGVGVMATAAYQVGPGAQLPFPAIAYHLFVDEGGLVSLCHGLDTRTWHNGGPGRNERAIGLCYAGNAAPNATQRAGLRRAIKWCSERLGRSLTVAGHKDSSPTGCPGPAWPGWKAGVLP